MDASDYETPVISLRHGHLMHVTSTSTSYADTGERYDWANPRPCKGCDKKVEPGRQDPCIAGLPGTCSACCGHGVDRDPYDNQPAGYVALNNGTTIRFSGCVGADRIRAAVQAALDKKPLPEGFYYETLVL
jgi:hypothetical protein